MIEWPAQALGHTAGNQKIQSSNAPDDCNPENCKEKTTNNYCFCSFMAEYVKKL
jgi:hypothetical protein